MPPISSTISETKTLPTYRVRTMAGDLESSKNGTAPSYTPITIEPPPDRAPPTQPTNAKPVIPEKINLSFPKIDRPVVNQPEKKIQPDNNWPPISKSNPPFNAPISRPIMPPQKQPQSFAPAGPPLDLPTERSLPQPTPGAPRPLTPPPAPPPIPLPNIRSQNIPQPNRPPLPPLPRPTPPSALPPLPQMPKSIPVLRQPENGSKKKLVIMAVLGAAIITFAVGEIWWFFLRGNPGTETVQELLPPPQELQPLLPLEEITAIPTEEVSLPALLAYNRTENIE